MTRPSLLKGIYRDLGRDQVGADGRLPSPIRGGRHSARFSKIGFKVKPRGESILVRIEAQTTQVAT